MSYEYSTLLYNSVCNVMLEKEKLAVNSKTGNVQNRVKRTKNV